MQAYFPRILELTSLCPTSSPKHAEAHERMGKSPKIHRHLKVSLSLAPTSGVALTFCQAMPLQDYLTLCRTTVLVDMDHRCGPGVTGST